MTANIQVISIKINKLLHFVCHKLCVHIEYCFNIQQKKIEGKKGGDKTYKLC